MASRTHVATHAGGRRTLAFVATLALGASAGLASAPGATAATSCPDADGRPAEIGAARASAAVACLVDHEREAVGLAPLAANARAGQAAQGHADDMAARNYFAHAAPSPAPAGTLPQDRLDRVGYDWGEMSENIARGQPTARAAMGAWLASPPHCTALMAPGVTTLGVGVSSAGSGPFWVQVLARPSAVAAPPGPAVSCPRTAATPAPDGAPSPRAGDGRPGASGGGTGGGEAGSAAGGKAGGGKAGGNDGAGKAGAGKNGDGGGSGDGTTGAGGKGSGGSKARGGDASGGSAGPGGRKAGSSDGPGSATGAGATSDAAPHRLRASATRSRRRLTVLVDVPSAAGPGRVPVVVRVQQRGRTVRTLRLRLAPGRVRIVRVGLPAARAGRARVTSGRRVVGAGFR